MRIPLLNNPFVYLRCICLFLVLLCAYGAAAQAPVITSVTPNIASAGSTITIIGSNFNPIPSDNVVYFGSTRAAVTAATATQLTVILDTGAVFGPVSVLNTTNQLSGYQADKFMPTFNSSYFYQDTINLRFPPVFTSTLLTVGEAAGSGDPAFAYITVLGDLDGDNKPDLVTTNRHETLPSGPFHPGNLVIYRNVSSPGWINNASFAIVGSVFPSGSLPGGNQPTSVKLADFDGDGKLDIVIAQLGNSKVAVYRNTSTLGNITFAPLVDFLIFPNGVAPYVLGIADFDKDGKPDVAVTCRDSANVVVLQNTSTVGAVSFNVSTGFRCGRYPIGICTGDLDGDGFSDIAIADDSSETVSVLKNISLSGTINFAPRIILPASGMVSDIQSVDIDGDGKLDLASTVTSGAKFILYRNVGSPSIIDAATFEAGVDYATSSSGAAQPAGLGVGDLNGDGKPDLVIANAATNRIAIFRNTSVAGAPFSAVSLAARMEVTSGAGTTPLGVNLGDLDGDGYPEIVVANNNKGTVSVFRDYPLPIMDTISGPSIICASGPSVTLASGTVGGVWTLTNNTLASIDTVTGMLTPHLPGRDTVILYKIAGGDTSSRRFIITIDSVIAVPAISGPVSQCIGTPIVLTNTMSGGVWATSDAAIATITPSGTSVTVNGVNEGIVNITYSFTNTCGTISATKTDTVKAIPSPGTIAGVAAVCGAGATTVLNDTATGGTWSSNDPLIATVNSSGMVTGVAPSGSTTISYTVSNTCGSASATIPFVVNVAPVAGTITGTTNTVCEGSVLTLNNATTGGVWSSSIPAVATVSGGVVGGASIGNSIISYTVTNACGFATDTQMVHVNPLPVVAPIVGPTSLCNGASTLYSNPVMGTWSSSNTSVATINGSGAAGGAGVGTTIISYTVTSPFGCGNAYDTVLLTVDAAPFAGTISGPTNVCVGSVITLVNGATGGSWISGNTARATVSGGATTGVSAGNVIISYSSTNSCGTAVDTQMVVVNPMPNAGTIAGATSVCAGANITLTNTASGGSWSSSAPAIASVVAGVVHGATAGTTIISYSATNSCGTLVDTQMVTVIAAPVAGIITGPTAVCQGTDITLSASGAGGVWGSNAPGVATVSAGVVSGLATGTAIISYSISNGCGATTDTQMVTVLPQPNAGTITGPHRVCTGLNITLTGAVGSGTWTSSSSAATVTGGVVQGVSVGVAIISYSVTNSCGTAVDTQLVTVDLSPDAGHISGPVSVCVGNTINLSNTSSSGSWSSSGAGAIVTSGGIVGGVSAGSVIISYSATAGCGTAVDTQMITVLPLPDAGSITGSHTVCTGFDITLINTASGGSWTSGAPLIASITGGVVHGAAVGVAVISYTVTNSCGTAVDTQLVQVDLSPSAGLITGPAFVCEGSLITLANSATSGSWSSGNTSTATVSGGVVSGVGAGSVVISYSVTNSCGTAVDTQMVTVNPLPDAGVITGGSVVCTGVDLTLSNATSGGTWSSSDMAVATVVSGVVHGAAVGTVIISYSVSNSCGTDVDTQMVQVDLSPSAGLIAGPASVCEGSLITLTNSATTGSWLSGNMGAATVSGGVVGGVSAGSAIISYSVTNSCGTAVDTQMIAVNPLPQAGILTGLSTVCTGQAITLLPSVSSGVWSASNGLATVSGGVVTGVNPGLDTISYAVTNGCGTDIVTTVVTINLSPSVNPITGLNNVCAGQTITLLNTTPGGTWSASNGHATVAGGVVTGVNTGVDTITYTITNGCGTVTATHAVTVDTLPPAGTITGLPSVCVGAAITLSNIVAGGVWSATNALATVASGVVTGVSGGMDTIVYTTTNLCGSVSVTKEILVNNSTYVDTISGPSTVCEGQVITLSNLVTGGVWTSDNLPVATVDTAGVVAGVSGGTATISYAVTTVCGTATATKNITVNPLPFAGGITGPTHICLGSAITLTDTIAGGVWSASNGFATVSGGVVTAVSPGTDTISYTVSNLCGSATVTHVVIVDALPDTGIITGASSACVGSAIVLADTVAGGIWSSSDTTVATITGSGVLTGISTGTIVVGYTVSLGCNVLSAHHIVVVHAIPVLTSTLTPAAICDNTLFGYVPATATGGASITWQRDTIAGISNTSSGGAGTISETLDNTTALPVNVTYQVMLTANGCADTQNVVVTVKPTPELLSSLTAAVCGGTIFDYIPVSATPGATYIWSRAAVLGVTPASSSGTGIVHDSVINNIGVNVTVVYVFTITANGCSNIQQVNVTLSQGAHKPHIDIKSPSVLCLNTLYQNFGTVDTPYAGEHYTWSATSPAAIWATGAGAQNCLIHFTGAGMSWVYLTSTVASSGCALRDSFAVLVDGGISELPNILYFENQFVCNPSDEDTYQWGYDDVLTLDSTLLTGETNQNYYNPAPDYTGKYYWVITTHHGCMQKTYYNAPVAIANVNAAVLDMSIVPNPNNGSFTMNVLSANSQSVHIVVTNLLGQVVQEWNTNTNTKQQVDLNVAAGTYLVSAITANGRLTERVVVGE